MTINQTIEDKLNHWLEGAPLLEKALNVYGARKKEIGERARQQAEQEYDKDASESKIASIIEEAMTGVRQEARKVGRPKKSPPASSSAPTVQENVGLPIERQVQTEGEVK